MLRRLGVPSVLCAAAIVYAPAFAAPFVFDDLSAIRDNSNLRQFATAFSPPDDTSLTGRPIVHASFAVNYALGGLSPVGYRACNLGLHLANALLLYALLARLFRRCRLPNGAVAAVATLWTLHPLQTEAVVYVTQRTELMASLCVLVALHFAVTAFDAPERRRRLALLACLACAIGSGCKETVIVVPALALCLDLAFFSPSLRAALQRHRVVYLGFALGLAPLCLNLLENPRGRTAGFGLGVSPLENLALQGQAILHYLRLVVWPDPLSVTYNWPIHDAFVHYWPADLAIASLLALTIWLTVRRSRAALPGWFFFSLLAPSSSVVPIISELVAERRMYLALAAVISVPVLLLARAGRPALAAVGCAALACAYTARSFERTGDYRSAEVLFASALRAAPDNPQAMWGLAQAREARGDATSARALYERMAEKSYPYVGPASWGTRGLIAEAELLERAGQRDAAAQVLGRALRHDPGSAVGRLQSAEDLARAGDAKGALTALQAMLGQPYLHDRVHLELGRLQLRLGDEPSAREHLTLALRLAPDRARMAERITAMAAGHRDP